MICWTWPRVHWVTHSPLSWPRPRRCPLGDTLTSFLASTSTVSIGWRTHLFLGLDLDGVHWVTHSPLSWPQPRRCPLGDALTSFLASTSTVSTGWHTHLFLGLDLDGVHWVTHSPLSWPRPRRCPARSWSWASRSRRTSWWARAAGRSARAAWRTPATRRSPACPARWGSGSSSWGCRLASRPAGSWTWGSAPGTMWESRSCDDAACYSIWNNILWASVSVVVKSNMILRHLFLT